MTPSTVHHGLAEQTHTARTAVLDAAFAINPERFVRRAPARRRYRPAHGSTNPPTPRRSLTKPSPHLSHRA